MQTPDSPNAAQIVHIEAKLLRDLRGILAEKGLGEAIQFAQDHTQNKLWKTISETALTNLEFDTANMAMVRCMDYQGIQFIKRMKKLDDSLKKSAEVAAFCHQFENAEKQYLDMDRKDLAVDLRMRMGDWFRVVQLIKTGSASDDKILEEAWNNIGDYYYDRQRWCLILTRPQAITYYTQGRNTDRLIDLYFIMEDFDNLDKLSSSLSENDSRLRVNNSN